MNELIEKLRESSEFLTRERAPLRNLSRHVREKYIAICRKILRVKNMEKTLDVMRFWN